MKEEDLVKIKLTGEIGMILITLEENNRGYRKGFQVRLPNYDVVKFYDFELSPFKKEE